MTDADLAALLAGTAGAAPGLRPVADVLAALTAGASAAELAGEDRALAEFRRRTCAPAARATRPRATRLTSRLGVKLAAAGTGLAVVLGGAATAAFANVLPAPIQRFAHETIGAPAPPARQGTPGRGRPAVPAVPAPGRHPLAHGTPRAGERPSPHATAPGNPHGKSGAGNPHAHGNHGNPHGSGQHGNGTGQGNGQGGGGQGNNGHGQGNNGQRQSGKPHATGRHGSPHTPADRAAHRPGPARGKPGTT